MDDNLFQADRPAKNNGHIDIDVLKAAARGRELELLTALGHIPAEFLDGRHHPCPACGGRDRFRLLDCDAGACFCNQCFSEGNGDWIAAVQHYRGWTFPETTAESAQYLNLDSHNGKSPFTGDLIEAFARIKRCPIESLVAFGAVANPQDQSVTFPQFDASGKQCSTFTVWPLSSNPKQLKGLNQEGHPSGMLLPVDDDGAAIRPTAGSTIVVTEGCKDGCTLHGLGFNAIGLPGKYIKDIWLPFFKGVNVVLCLDNDAAGFEAQKKLATKLQGVAKSVRVVTLPAPGDVRDAIAAVGVGAVRTAIASAPLAGAESIDTGIISIGELVAANPTLRPPIIDGLLRLGETANLIADPKIGKSWFSYGVTLNVCTGGDWLGYPCEQGRVLLIDNELHASTLANRIPKVANALGIDEADYRSQLDVLSLRGRLIDLHGINRLLTQVEKGAYDLIVLDAWYRCLPDGVSENENTPIAMLYNLIDQMAESLNCAWLNIHHASKGNQSAKSVTDTGAGAGSQSRAADSHIVLRKHQEDGIVVMDAAVRSFKPVTPIALRWEFPLWHPALDVDPAKLDGLLTSGEKRQSAKDVEGCDKILAALSKGDATERELRTRGVGMGKDRCERLLGMLVDAEKVIPCETIRRGNTCQLYRLTGDVVCDDGPRNGPPDHVG